MPIDFRCPHCGKQTAVTDGYLGQTGPCGGCGQAITIPVPEGIGDRSCLPAKVNADGVGFTVALACFGGLLLLLLCGLALLIPAIQAARETARRTQCNNSPKNFSGGYANYQELHKVLPGQAGATMLAALAVPADEPQRPTGAKPRAETRPEPVSFEQKAVDLMYDKPSTVLAVAYSPDGQRVVSLHADRTIGFRDARTGQQHGILKGAEAEIACLALSADGKLLATGGTDEVITLWDVTAADPAPADPAARVRAVRRKTLAGHTNSIFALAFSRDGRWLASGSYDHTARLWSVAEGSVKATLAEHTDTVRTVAFSPDDRQLATGSADRTVKLWDVGTAKVRATFEGHQDTVSAVAFSPDGATLASGSQDRTVKLWKVARDGAVPRPNDDPVRATLAGHSRGVWCLAFSPQGRILASGGLDNVCRLWNPQNGALRAELPHASAVTAVAFAPDTSALLTGTFDGALAVRDAKMFAVPIVGPLKTLPGPRDMLITTAISPDGQLLAAAGKDVVVTLYKLPTCERVCQLSGHASGVCHLAFSPDGKTLGACMYNGQFLLWDTQAGKKLWLLPGHPQGTRRIAFAPDGRKIATAGWDQTAKLWNLATGQLLHTLPEQTLPVSDVAFSPDGRTLATTTGTWRNWRAPGEVKLWDVETGRELARVGNHFLEIKGVMFDPRGTHLYSYGPGGVRVWDVAAREPLATIAEQTPVCAAVLLPDGNHLALGDNEGGLAIWHVATDKPVLRYTGHEDLLFHLACSADGARLASVGKEGALKVWPVHLSEEKTREQRKE